MKILTRIPVGKLISLYNPDGGGRAVSFAGAEPDRPAGPVAGVGLQSAEHQAGLCPADWACPESGERTPHAGLDVQRVQYSGTDGLGSAVRSDAAQRS
ncbi:MAG: hypothetical protein OXI05_01035 [Bacteroidota bacterium]|nr:hypothetical protein [Bacteroidota bacterium]MYJ19944.1 hypothetical protein [Rhodothermaceae bacterium]